MYFRCFFFVFLSNICFKAGVKPRDNTQVDFFVRHSLPPVEGISYMATCDDGTGDSKGFRSRTLVIKKNIEAISI